MRFVDKAGHSVSCDPAMWYMAERHYQAGSLFIHPDSLHLLEPELMDMVQGFQNDDIRILFPKEKFDGFKKSDKIIQRNYVQFMWPEIQA